MFKGFGLGISLGLTLGTLLETMLGSSLGSALGSILGSVLGFMLGSSLGVELGSPLGSTLGLMDGSPEGLTLGVELGSSLGRKLEGTGHVAGVTARLTAGRGRGGEVGPAVEGVLVGLGETVVDGGTHSPLATHALIQLPAGSVLGAYDSRSHQTL